MTEQDLINLGFQKEFTDSEGVYYYSYDFGPSGLSLITLECSDELPPEAGEWTVAFLDYPTLAYESHHAVYQIIKAIKNQ